MSCANTCGTEDLFRVQTELYSKYQIAENFFQRTGAWSVFRRHRFNPRFTDGVRSTDAAGSGDCNWLNTERFVPYYTLMRNPSTGENGL